MKVLGSVNAFVREIYPDGKTKAYRKVVGIYKKDREYFVKRGGKFFKAKLTSRGYKVKIYLDSPESVRKPAHDSLPDAFSNAIGHS